VCFRTVTKGHEAQPSGSACPSEPDCEGAVRTRSFRNHSLQLAQATVCRRRGLKRSLKNDRLRTAPLQSRLRRIRTP
jgi:hypothetical protein